MFRSAWLVLIAASSSIPNRALSAQRVRGVVRDSSASMPLPGVVVSVVDSAGNARARTIADAAGRYSLNLSPGAVRLRAVRIGYRPREVPLPRVEGDVTVDFAVLSLPVMLDAIRVSDEQLCPGSSDRGAAFEVWEQARAGLLASVVARETNPATATALVYHRTVSMGDNVVRLQTTELRTAVVARPFLASASPASFAERGYIAEDQFGRTYLGPDADVLLDESFVLTHCFHLVSADANHRGQIGLAFTPVAGRDTIVDVTGTLWLDRAAAAIHSLDFRYTGLEPAALREGVGGHIQFRSVSSGVAFVEHWSLRLPVMTQFAVMGFGGRNQAPRRKDRKDFQVSEFREAGGQVLAVEWNTGLTWRDTPTRVAGVVTERGSGRPASFALVTLAGTSDTAVADSAGRFVLGRVIPGRYTIMAVDTTLDAFAASARQTFRLVDVAPGGGVTTVEMELPPSNDIASRMCRGKQPANSVTILGRVLTGNGSPLRGALVTAATTTPVRSWEATLDGNGRFALCGLAPDEPVRMRLSTNKKGLVLGDTVIVPRARSATIVEWRP